jgi:glyoxylase-like metal-dependent hydrolase (beta-lactamase superfamily II)
MELVSGVYSMSQRQGGHIHAFLLDDGSGELVLIDTLWNTNASVVLQQLQRLNRPAASLKHIVLTHGHRSHLGGLAALKQLSGARIYAHEWESDIIAGEREAQRVSLVPGRPLRPYWRVYQFQAGLALGMGKSPPCAVDESVTEGDRIGPLHVFHMPGHSPGHLAFYWPERQILFAGDAIATWPELNAGWPAFNLNMKQLSESLHRMAELDATVVAVGHGEPITTQAQEHVQEFARRQKSF